MDRHKVRVSPQDLLVFQRCGSDAVESPSILERCRRSTIRRATLRSLVNTYKPPPPSQVKIIIFITAVVAILVIAVVPAPAWFVVKHGHCTAFVSLWSIEISGEMCSYQIRTLSFTGKNSIDCQNSTYSEMPPKRTSKEILLVYCSTFIIFASFIYQRETLRMFRVHEGYIWISRVLILVVVIQTVLTSMALYWFCVRMRIITVLEDAMDAVASSALFLLGSVVELTVAEGRSFSRFTGSPIYGMAFHAFVVATGIAVFATIYFRFSIDWEDYYKQADE